MGLGLQGVRGALNSGGGAGANPRSGFRPGLPPLPPNLLKGPMLGCSFLCRDEETLTDQLNASLTLEIWDKIPEEPRPPEL